MHDYASPEELIKRVARSGLTRESNRLLERSRFYLDHQGLMPTAVDLRLGQRFSVQNCRGSW